MILVRCAAVIVLLLFAAGRIHGVEPEIVVPADVQVALFINVLKLDRNFDSSKGFTIAIVYQREYRASVLAKDDVAAAIGRIDPLIRFTLVDANTQEDLRTLLSTVAADVVYVTPLRAVDVAEISSISRRRGMRTFTGVPAYVDAGLAVGVGLRQNRPLILINLSGARAEGAAFSAQLLSLARIVGPVR